MIRKNLSRLFILPAFIIFGGCFSHRDDFIYFVEQTDDASLTADKRHRFIEFLKAEELLKDEEKLNVILLMIVLKNNKELLALLHSHADDIISSEQCDLMMRACCDAETMKCILLLKNANPHETTYDPLGRTALFIHAGHKQCNSIEILLRLGFCDVNAKDRRGFSPILLCAQRGSLFNLKKLIEWHADIFAKSYSGKTSLHMAACRDDDDIEFAKFLLSAGVDINATDAWGNTALFYAYSSGNKRIVDFLLHSGADPSIKNNDGFLYNQYKLQDDILNTVY